MVKRFRFLPIPLKHREGFGEGREPLPELQGGSGGAQPPPRDGPRRKIPYISSSAQMYTVNSFLSGGLGGPVGGSRTGRSSGKPLLPPMLNTPPPGPPKPLPGPPEPPPGQLEMSWDNSAQSLIVVALIVVKLFGVSNFTRNDSLRVVYIFGH